jgi:hypothetical protein
MHAMLSRGTVGDRPDGLMRVKRMLNQSWPTGIVPISSLVCPTGLTEAGGAADAANDPHPLAPGMSYGCDDSGGHMAKDKSIVDRISDTVKEIVDGASAAAAKVLETDAGMTAETPVERADTPDAADAVATPVPPGPRQKRRPSAFRANKRVSKSLMAGKAHGKTTAKKASKKAAPQKSAGTSKAPVKAAKKAKNSATRTPKKTGKKKSKASKR